MRQSTLWQALGLWLGLLLAFSAQAQTFSRDVWHDGEVDLFSGEVLRGRLKYDLDNNNIQLTYGGVIKSYSAYQVESFQFFDEIQKLPRAFYALPFKKGNYEAPYFFELLAEGELSLLNREVLTQRVVTPTGAWGWGWGRPMGMGTTIPQIEDSYYVLDTPNEKVYKMDDPKHDLMALMKAYADEVTAHAKSNKLNLNRREDLVRLFNYYNSLKAGASTN